MMRTFIIKLNMHTSRVDKQITSRHVKPVTSTRNSSKIWKSEGNIMHVVARATAAASAAATMAVAPVLSPMLRFPKRLLTSRKNSSSKNSTSDNVVLPVIARKRSPKTWLPLTRTGIRETDFWRPTIPSFGARRLTRWGRRWRLHKVMEKARVHASVYIVRTGKVVGRNPRPSRHNPRSRKSGSRNGWVNASVTNSQLVFPKHHKYRRDISKKVRFGEIPTTCGVAGSKGGVHGSCSCSQSRISARTSHLINHSIHLLSIWY